MEMRLTIRDLMDRWAWEDACEMLGINPRAVNEGLMDHTDIITLTEDQASELGLIT